MEKKKYTGHLIALAILCIAAVVVLAKTVSVAHRTAELQVMEVTPTPSPQEPETPPETPKSTTLELLVNDLPVSIPLDSSESVYDCTSLNTEFDTVISTKDTTHEITVNSQPMVNGAVSLKPASIDANTRITLTVDNRTYYLRTLPKDFPPLFTQGESMKDGFYYTTMGSYVVKFDKTGQVVFYRRAKAANAGPFRRNEVDGEVIYSYLENRTYEEHPKMPGYFYLQTSLVMLDEQYHKIQEVTYMNPTDKVPEQYPLENHDYHILGKNHYLLTTYLGKRINNIPADVKGSEFGANVVACIIQEVDNGEVIFEWDSTDYPQLYGASYEGDFTNTSELWTDYAHLNAMSIDPRDNNILISFRNLDSIIKIHRETGEILWILGGKLDQFGITDFQQFHRQHNITVTEDGAFLLFDNGYLEDTLDDPDIPGREKRIIDENQYSRGLKFVLDEKNKKILDMEEYRVENFFSVAMGSAQILDEPTDTLLLNWGYKSRDGMPLFQEVNFRDKSVNFEIICGDPEIRCYRVTYYDK